MKELENYGLVEMNFEEAKEINGGDMWKLPSYRQIVKFLEVVGVMEAAHDIAEGLQDGFNRQHN
jgi:hypothetical protein